MSCQYESAFNLKKYITFILQNNDIFALNSLQMKGLNNELRRNNQKLDEFINEIAAKDSEVIQLYQTKRSAIEILHFKKKYLKRLMNKGCLNKQEVDDINLSIQKCVHKCELFGFTLNQNYLKGIFIFNSRHLLLQFFVRKPERK